MATIADEMLQALEGTLPRSGAPRVRALHLPPRPWSGGKAGEFCALELDDGALGLSYVLLDDSLAGLDRLESDTPVVGTDAMALARRWLHADAAQRALGFSAVNALTTSFHARAGYAPPDATDSIGGIDPQPGEHIGMVGFFPPLVKQVTSRGARLTVLELRADLAGEHAQFRVTLDPRALAGCDKLLCTSTALLNHTLDDVLAQAAGAREVALIGPGAGCLPDALFSRGVTRLCGTWVEDRPAFVAALTHGQAWGAHARKAEIRRAGYPGAASLRARAGLVAGC